MSLYVLILAAIIKCHRLPGLNNKHLFLIVLEAGQSQMKVSTDSGSGDGLLSDLQRDTLLLYSAWQRRREGGGVRGERKKEGGRRRERGRERKRVGGRARACASK